ncbi:MAG: sensor histidine kinase [Putridiphycobacter sp.]
MIFTPPKTNFEDYYDIARYNLTWKICVFLALFLPAFGAGLFFINENTFYPTLAAVVVILFLVYTIKKTKDYKLPAIIFAVLGTVLIQITFLFFIESLHFVDTMWMMVIIMFSFFTLGKKWGAAIIGLNLIGILYFVFFLLETNISNLRDVQLNELIVMAVNFMICGVLIAYLISQFINVTNKAEAKYKKLNHDLKVNNEEKTIMLKEIHHRVKNNLQVITSLLRLQSRDIEERKFKELYQESINRVVAMSLIHEKMYQSENLAKIKLEEYIKSLADDLLNSYAVQKEIKISVKSEIENIQNKSLVPLALIFNELISNSLKHAFVEVCEGEISISILDCQTHITLDYSDNGTWKFTDNSSSFGMELIDSLTDQLSGKFTRTVNNGTSYNFIFAPEPKS